MGGRRPLVWSLLAGSLWAVAANGSPLADAAKQQDWPALQALVGTAEDLDAAQPDGSNALLWAVHHDHAASVALLLSRGANPDVRNRYGITPLAEAALNGNADIVRQLLAAGADPNAEVREGETPLMLAARSGSVPAVEALLAAGAAVDARETWQGQTALMWAAGENHPEVVRVLVAAGAEIDARSQAFDWKDIKQGGVMSALPNGGLTALMHAARQNAYDAAVVLLELGADPNLKDPRGVSTFRIAAANEHFDLAMALLERGADPDEGGLPEVVKAGTTSLMRAATNRPDTVTLHGLVDALLARGAKADSLGAVGLPKKDAFGGGDGPGVPSETALYLAAAGGDADLVRTLLEQGANANHATRTGATPLMAALEFVQRRPQAAGPTPPPKRSIENRRVAALALLERGADVNAADANGMTALHWMADQGANELIEFLVARGARLDLKDLSNRTALDIARGAPPAVRPGSPDVGPVLHEPTAALLRNLMAQAGVREMPYVAPPAQAAAAAVEPAPAAPSAAEASRPVTAIILRD